MAQSTAQFTGQTASQSEVRFSIKTGQDLSVIPDDAWRALEARFGRLNRALPGRGTSVYAGRCPSLSTLHPDVLLIFARHGGEVVAA